MFPRVQFNLTIQLIYAIWGPQNTSQIKRQVAGPVMPNPCWVGEGATLLAPYEPDSLITQLSQTWILNAFKAAPLAWPCEKNPN